tara:strand:- start:11009 stop:11728 length:720 start_codon:yes stop_codon:yes gene_type:complete
MPLHNIFPTPVYSKQLLGSKQSEINQELYSVYKPDEMVKNTHTYNHTSSHQVSCDEEGHMFATNIVKETPKFTKFLQDHFLDYLFQLGMVNPIPFAITESWFTKTSKGEHAPIHAHGNSDISGVYYLQTNGNDGELVIKNPMNCTNNNIIMFLNSMKWGEKRMPLKPGLLLLWPAFLEHGTYLNQTPEDRISFSFNITVSQPPYINTKSDSVAETKAHLYEPRMLPDQWKSLENKQAPQ